MPHVTIIAGPNGAGKTTFAIEYVLERRTQLNFVNADELARDIERTGLGLEETDRRAARMMLARIDTLAAAGIDFMFETTLASLTYARKIRKWRKHGYLVSLIYLRLPSAEASIARVRHRVANGGHDIPVEVIRRRFEKSTIYLEEIYKHIVDEWYLWDSLDRSFALKQSWDQT